MVIKANKPAGMEAGLEILNGKYPAKAHAKKVAEHIIKNGGDPKGVLYLEGQKLRMIEVRRSLESKFMASTDFK